MRARSHHPASRKSSRPQDPPPPGRHWRWRENSFTSHELVKPAELSVLGAVLMQKREIGLVELAEEFVPLDFFKLIFRGSKINPKNTRVPVLFGGADGCRPPVALFCPFFDDLVIRGRCAVAHRHFPRSGADRSKPVSRCFLMKRRK